MIKKIIRRIKRQPLPCIAVCLLAAVLSVSLCHLQHSLEEERLSFEQTCNSIPVHFKITELDGSKFEGKTGIAKWAMNEFLLNDGDFNKLSRELFVRVDYKGVIPEEDKEAVPTTPFSGITSIGAAEELSPSRGSRVRWYEGYDESIFTTKELVCLVPEDFKGGDEIEVTFTGKDKLDFVVDGNKTEINRSYVQHTAKFTVVGRYTDEGNETVYCPYKTMVSLLDMIEIAKETCVSYLGATLTNSLDIDKLREARAKWFAEPNPTGEQTPWEGEEAYSKYYLYALDIEDSLLRTLESNMKNSIFLNKFASVIVFILSAGAGFLTGFLIIRSRKREITLMRTVGESNREVYFNFALEQMACAIVGIAFGGAYNLWDPIGQLLIFAVIYYTGLSVALAIFLRKNLLATIKEDE